MSLLVKESDIEIERLTLGPWGTNAYIVTCPTTRHSLLVDAPADADEILAHLEDPHPQYILLTHNHPDHLGALEDLHQALKVPLGIHPLDADPLPVRPDIMLNDGDKIKLGELTLEVMHTPGHTPGSLCFRYGRHLTSGDTIFPGGPGKTATPTAFRQILQSITAKILTLPDDTRIYPGHGESALLSAEKTAIAAFIARHHQPDLCGDVLWLTD